MKLLVLSGPEVYGLLPPGDARRARGPGPRRGVPAAPHGVFPRGDDPPSTPRRGAAALFADSRESVLAESGDFRLAEADGAIGPEHIRAEIGEVLTGCAPGRAGDDEVTVFESLGLAVEDLAAAALAYRKAAELGAGTWVEF